MDTTKPPAPNAPDLEKKAESARPDAEPRTTGAPTPEPQAVKDRDQDQDQDQEPDQEPDLEPDDEAYEEEQQRGEVEPGHVGSAAAAIVAAGLSLVALSGSWVAGIVSERKSVTGRLGLTQAADTNGQIAAQFAGPWHATALVNGVFSTLALVIAVFVLALPAFSSPERHLPQWVRSVSWAAIALGSLGIVLFLLMYFDLLLAIPSAPAA